MPSKAQGLSLNTIIIATLVLIVLVVLVMILTGYMGKVWSPGFASATDTCQGKGGKIIAKSGSCGSGYTLSSGTAYNDFTEEGQQCCLPLKKCSDFKSGSNAGRCFSSGTSCGERFPDGDWSCNGGICCP